MTRRIIIKDGQICGFADEVNIDGVTIEQTEKTRVSHIVPKNWLLRVAFLALRGAVRDESRAAEWTRNWHCLWLVKIEKETFGPFCDRQKAIQFEKNKIYEQGKLTPGGLPNLSNSP